MSWTAWKSLEKEAADFFGGSRIVRVYYGESRGDIDHPTLAIECKYGKSIPKYTIPNGPVTILNKTYMLINSADLTHFGSYETTHRQKPSVEFIEKGIAQALSYPQCALKTPLMALKPPRYQGFIIILRLSDIPLFLSQVSSATN